MTRDEVIKAGGEICGDTLKITFNEETNCYEGVAAFSKDKVWVGASFREVLKMIQEAHKEHYK